MSSIFIVAVNDVGHIKMYETNSTIIVAISLKYVIILNCVGVSTLPNIEN